MAASHFDEKSGVVVCPTPWGRWWQTVHEVTVEVDLVKGTRAKEVKVEIKPKYIQCRVKQTVIFEGKLHGTVVADESIWTVEEQKLLRIQLVRADGLSAEKPWTSLLEGQFAPDAWTFHEMQKKLDLERFQIEHPGFDFSSAKLSKTYDNPLPDFTNSMDGVKISSKKACTYNWTKACCLLGCQNLQGRFHKAERFLKHLKMGLTPRRQQVKNILNSK